MLSLLKRKPKAPVVIEPQPAEPVRRTHQQNIKVSEDCSAAFAVLAEAQGISKAALVRGHGGRAARGVAEAGRLASGLAGIGKGQSYVSRSRWSFSIGASGKPGCGHARD